MQQARIASKLLNVHWTSVYRLRRRFLANPVASSVAPKARGPKAGGTRLEGKVEDILDDVLCRWLPRQRELAHPLLDLWTEVKRRCERVRVKPPARSTVARRWARHREEQAAALALLPGAQVAPGSLIATRPLEIVQIDHTLVDLLVVDAVNRQPLQRPWLTLAIDAPCPQ
jgi:putative transposase